VDSPAHDRLRPTPLSSSIHDAMDMLSYLSTAYAAYTSFPPLAITAAALAALPGKSRPGLLAAKREMTRQEATKAVLTSDDDSAMRHSTLEPDAPFTTYARVLVVRGGWRWRAKLTTCRT